MKIAMVCVEDALMNVGFRKMCAQVKELHAQTQIFYVTYTNYRSLKAALLGRYGDAPQVPPDIINHMAEPLAAFDLVAFSSMSGYAQLVKALIERLRQINPRAYILWGGIHPIMVPDDAVRHADAVCTGEGEFAFRYFFEAYKSGRDYLSTGNFWFRTRDAAGAEKIIRNPFLPLMTSDEMTSLPLLHYGEDEFIYQRGRGYVPLDREIYIRYNGLGYNTVWSIGCPFQCSYCGNTKFIENDAGYRKIRHASVDTIIAEINQARVRHPHLSTILFHDDSFMALPLETLRHFAAEYKKNIGLPFAVYGVIPNYVRQDKLEILLDAGLNRIRMGIQNGSENILKFYDRPTPPEKILQAAKTINRFKKYMIPPAYDIILDNPIETREDVQANLSFLRKLPRPFTLNVYSLRTIPNTVLEKQMRERGLSIDEISTNYLGVAPTLANCLVFLMAAVRVPGWLYERWLRKAQPLTKAEKKHGALLLACRAVFFVRRAWDHLRFMDFTVMAGNKLCWLLWKTGAIRLWQKHMVPQYALEEKPVETLQPLSV